ncbi:hypothetical protein [Blastococcus capsensis]|uniref:hypothetical protein n=1 Tax=Blastococcus capsensis TaxID=1564163 RepID=UPI00253FA394|nr:hypothetical protein [Blastococcus capsensis]MDK3254887.1 hypothetical protein [Blastococcus capsensis]
MVFWIVLAVVVVLALVTLGVVAYGVLGAFGRLDRELAAAERDIAPVRAEIQQSAERAAQVRNERATAG